MRGWAWCQVSPSISQTWLLHSQMTMEGHGALTPYLLGKNRSYPGQRLFWSGMCPDIRSEVWSLNFLTPGWLPHGAQGGSEGGCPSLVGQWRPAVRTGSICGCLGDFHQAWALAWVPVKGRGMPGFSS